MLPQFLVMQAHEDERVTFLLYQFVNLRIVVPLVFSAENEDGWCGHGLQRVPAGVDIRGLRIVDPSDTPNGCYVLQAVCRALERHQAFADYLFADAHNVRRNSRSHRVEHIVPPFECQFVFADG